MRLVVLERIESGDDHGIEEIRVGRSLDAVRQQSASFCCHCCLWVLYQDYYVKCYSTVISREAATRTVTGWLVFLLWSTAAGCRYPRTPQRHCLCPSNVL